MNQHDTNRCTPKFGSSAKGWSPRGCVGSFMGTTMKRTTRKRQRRTRPEGYGNASDRATPPRREDDRLVGYQKCGGGFRKYLTAGVAAQ